MANMVNVYQYIIPLNGLNIHTFISSRENYQYTHLAINPRTLPRVNSTTSIYFRREFFLLLSITSLMLLLVLLFQRRRRVITTTMVRSRTKTKANFLNKKPTIKYGECGVIPMNDFRIENAHEVFSCLKYGN